MDRWLARVHADRRDIPLSRKIILDKPDIVAARCTNGAGVDQPAEVCDQAVASYAPGLFRRLEALYASCADPAADALEKHGAALDFFTFMHDALQPAPAAKLAGRQLQRAADYLREHRAGTPTLDDLCAAIRTYASAPATAPA